MRTRVSKSTSQRVGLAMLLVAAAVCAAFAQKLPWQDTPEAGGKTPATVRFEGPEQAEVAARKSQVVELRFRIQDGYHINSHTPHEKNLIPTQLMVVDGDGVNVAAVDFPPGADTSFPFAPNEKLSVYTGMVTLRAHVTVDAWRASAAGRAALSGMRRECVHAAAQDSSCGESAGQVVRRLRDSIPAMHRISFACLLVLASALPLRVFAQAPDPQSPQARIAQMLNPSPGAWTPAQIANMERLRDAALSDPYALTELRHLTDNIGPRLAGSPQAQHAVEWVADEMRALGATVTIEKTTVPHWVRGAETAELTAWPGMTPSTTQKIVLTALGGSVATPKDGISAPVVVVDSFADLKALPKDAVKGKILLFNEHFDKDLAAQGRGGEAYGEAVLYRGAAPSVAASAGRSGDAGAFGGRRGLSFAAHRHDVLLAGAAEDSCWRRDGGRRRPAEEPDLAGRGADAPDADAGNTGAGGDRERDRGLEGHRTSGAGGDRLRASGFVGPGDGRDR